MLEDPEEDTHICGVIEFAEEVVEGGYEQVDPVRQELDGERREAADVREQDRHVLVRLDKSLAENRGISLASHCSIRSSSSSSSSPFPSPFSSSSSSSLYT